LTAARDNALARGHDAAFAHGHDAPVALGHHTRAGHGYAVTGTIDPATQGTRVTVQRYDGHSWSRAGSGAITTGGGYSIPVAGPGVYRVRYHGIVGPRVAVK